MKRILLITLCAILAFSACLTSGYAAVKIATNEDAAVAETLLETLGVLEITDNGASEVTRADFACYIGRAIGVDEYVKPSEMYFRDVPTTHWAANCVNSLAALGAISYDGVTTFRPDDVITVNEAIKILVEVLGYGVVAEARGGYPTGYLRVANMIDLQAGVSANEKLALDDAAILISNALNTNMYVTVSYGGENNEYKQSDETLLSEYHDIHYIEGVVDATELTALDSGNGAGENKIRINGVVYDCTGNTFDYLGTYVSAYYKQSENETTGEIILIALANDADDIVKVTNEDFVSFGSDYILRYYSEEAEKVKSISIPKSASFIYNGIYVNENIVDYMNIDYGEIKVIRDENSQYSTVVIIDYLTVPVGYVDTERGYVYSATDNNTKIDLSGARSKVFIYDESGNEVNVGSIAKNNVLTVYENPGKLTYVYLSRKSVSGVIERIVTAGDEVRLTIDGVEYTVDKTFYDKEKNTLKSNANVNLYLDIRSKIAYVSVGGENNYEYGYLTNATFDSAMIPNLMLKIYITDGSFGIYKTDESVIIDGTKYKDLNLAKDALSKPGTTEIQPQLVRFIADDSGILKRVDTATRGAEETDDSLTQTAYTADGKTYDYISAGIIGKKIAFDKSTILFKVPKDNVAAEATEKMMTVTDLSKKIDWLGTEIAAYTANSESGISEVVIQKLDWTNVEPERRYNIMVDEIQNVINDDGEEVERIVGWRGGVQVKYDVDYDISLMNSGVEKGDLLILAVNAGNVVRNYHLIYDASENIIYDNDAADAYSDNIYSCNGSNYFGAQSMRFGYASSVKGTVVSMSYENGGEVEEVYPVSSTLAATVYDPTVGKGIIFKGDLSDIADYEHAGTDCSKLIVYAEYGVWKSYYIYK